MITRLAILALIAASTTSAEDVHVHRCVSGQDETVSLNEQLSTFTTGKKALQSFYDEYLKSSWRSEPFYGPVVHYIFKDSAGKLFLVHFEFQEGHKIFGKGTRFAMAPLVPVKGSKGLYKGSPYDGSSITDEGLLKQLRELARREQPRAK